MNNIISPDDFIINKTNSFPLLYASPSYNTSKFKILDDVFNTIGTGLNINDFYDFNYAPITDEVRQQAKKWHNCNLLYYGCIDSESITLKSGKTIKRSVSPLIVAHLEDKFNYPYVDEWFTRERTDIVVPYPNFNRDYSLVWSKDIIFSNLGNDWTNAAIWFYEQCLNYFNSDNVKFYNYYFPCQDEEKNEHIINSYDFHLSKYNSNNEISKAYNCEFIGDPHNKSDIANFITRRWEARYINIINFINETLTYLKSLIK